MGVCRCCTSVLVIVAVLYAGFFMFGSIPCDCGMTALDGLPGMDASHWTTTIVVDQGTERCWFTFKPPSVSDRTGSYPVVIDLHGNQACGYAPPFVSGFRQKAEEEGFLVVWPQGAQNLRTSSNIGNRMAAWNSYPKNRNTDFVIGATRGGIDDVAFLIKVIDHTLAAYPNADPTRVYVTGHSNGCYMAQRFAAEASTRIAAMGCFAAHLATPIPHDYVPVPIMVVHGTADTLAKYDAESRTAIDVIMGIDFPTAMQNIRQWAVANNCSPHQPKSAHYYTDTAETRYFETRYERGCTDGASATLVSLSGIGHFPYHEKYKTTIPVNSASHLIARLNFGNYPFSETVDTTTIVYEFMKKHRRNFQNADLRPPSSHRMSQTQESAHLDRTEL